MYFFRSDLNKIHLLKFEKREFLVLNKLSISYKNV